MSVAMLAFEELCNGSSDKDFEIPQRHRANSPWSPTWTLSERFRRSIDLEAMVANPWLDPLGLFGSLAGVTG
ncbi:MAG TPA: hypothetical protein DEP35_10505, partial [Deltaproteobacteria bacterium]|nr:hypothetical protein [Deltaproteobacteria bacterium]